MLRDDPRNIVKAGLCAGCGACAAIDSRGAIGMALSDDGFYRPDVSRVLDQQELDLVGKVCPGVGLAHNPSEDSRYDPAWGPIESLSTGHALDAEVRLTGSSGGVLTALSVYLIESKLVEYVVSTLADPEDPIGNVTAALSDRAAVLRAAGSRYGPSSPLANLETYLSRGARFAFVGKPCDVAALRRLAAVDPRIDVLVPYKLAFFCAGVPSRQGTLALLDKMGVELDDLEAFRYRGEGWPGLARATSLDGRSETMDYNSSWGSVLNRHLQFRCKICPDGTGEFADIACADAWYGKGGYPDFEERDGRSLIVARTLVGKQLLENAAANKIIEIKSQSIDDLKEMQPYQLSRKSNILARSLAIRLSGGRVPIYRNFGLFRLLLKNNILDSTRNFLGMLKRVSTKKNGIRN